MPWYNRPWRKTEANNEGPEEMLKKQKTDEPTGKDGTKTMDTGAVAPYR